MNGHIVRSKSPHRNNNLHSFQASKSHWLFDPQLLPAVYHQVVGAATNQFGLDSSVIYEVFLTSGLAQPILEHIWSVTSQCHPGWFTPAELISALALIGLAQTEQINRSHTSPEAMLQTLTVQRLHTLSSPPVPQVRLPATRAGTVARSSVPSTRLTSPNHLPVSTVLPGQSAQTTWPLNPPQNNPIILSSVQGSALIESKVNTPFDPVEDEWADFTSCKPPVDGNMCRPADPLDTIKYDFDWPKSGKMRNAKLSETGDDDFGDFQTSNGIEICRNPAKPDGSSGQNKTGVGLGSRPNYNVSVDPMSEMNPLESVQHEWFRCLVQCAELMQDSLDALEPLVSDVEKAEFNDIEDGKEFFYDILEVYMVAHRIRGSAERLALLHAPLQSKFAQIDAFMSKLSRYIIKDEIRKTWHSILTRSPPDTSSSLDALAGFINPGSTEPLCGVCLSPVPGGDQTGPADSARPSWSPGSVALAGRIYHTPCANLWINRVQLSLPALVPP